MGTPSMIKGINSSFSPIEIPKGVPAFGKKKNKKPANTVELNDYDYLCRKTMDMSCDELARYFADKAQKAIDALWDEGVINEKTIEEWGKEHMRTPYHYEAHRS